MEQMYIQEGPTGKIHLGISRGQFNDIIACAMSVVEGSPAPDFNPDYDKELASKMEKLMNYLDG